MSKDRNKKFQLNSDLFEKYTPSNNEEEKKLKTQEEKKLETQDKGEFKLGVLPSKDKKNWQCEYQATKIKDSSSINEKKPAKDDFRGLSNTVLEDSKKTQIIPKTENKINKSFQDSLNKDFDTYESPPAQDAKPNEVLENKELKLSDKESEHKDNQNEVFENKDSKSSIPSSEHKDNPNELLENKDSKCSVPSSEHKDNPNEVLENKDSKSSVQSSEHKDNPDEVLEKKDSKSSISESDDQIEHAPSHLAESRMKKLKSYVNLAHSDLCIFVQNLIKVISNIKPLKSYYASAFSTICSFLLNLLEEIVSKIEETKLIAIPYTKQVLEFLFDFQIEPMNYPILISKFESFESDSYENKERIVSDALEKMKIESITSLDKIYYRLAVKYLIGNLKQILYENISEMLEKEIKNKKSINEGIIEEIQKVNRKNLEITKGPSPFEYSRTLILNINRLNETNDIIKNIEEMKRKTTQGFDLSSLNNFIDLRF